jgi:hypothetical protein
MPWLEPFESDVQLNIHTSWDLSQTAENSKAAWAWGDGLSTRYVGSVESVIYTVFAVGPLLTSMKSQIKLPKAREETFGMYWMGDAPYNPAYLFESLSTLFAGMAPFFNDNGSGYKIFIRQSTVRSYGGTAFVRSFMYEYFPGFEASFSDSIFVLAHEMVHNWPSLGPCANSSTLYSLSKFHSHIHLVMMRPRGLTRALPIITAHCFPTGLE